MGTETRQVIRDGVRHALDLRNTFRWLAGMERYEGRQVYVEKRLKRFIERGAREKLDLVVGGEFAALSDPNMGWPEFFQEMVQARGVAVRVVVGPSFVPEMGQQLMVSGVQVRQLGQEPFQQFGVVDERHVWTEGIREKKIRRRVWWMVANSGWAGEGANEFENLWGAARGQSLGQEKSSY